MEIRKARCNTVSLYTVVLCSELCRGEFGFWIRGRRVYPLFLMGQNDVERYNLLSPREFYSAMPAFFCISLVIQETNYKRLVVVVYFRERVFLSSTTIYPLLSRDAGPVFVQETITQHTSRMASNDTTRCGYKLGLYDNEKKNLYEC